MLHRALDMQLLPSIQTASEPCLLNRLNILPWKRGYLLSSGLTPGICPQMCMRMLSVLVI